MMAWPITRFVSFFLVLCAAQGTAQECDARDGQCSVSDQEDDTNLLQTQADISRHATKPPNRKKTTSFPDSHKPRMLVSWGCSGSSFIMEVAAKLLNAHGITHLPLKAVQSGAESGGEDFEIMKPSKFCQNFKNPFCLSISGFRMPSAMQAANAEATKQGKTLVFKEQGAYSSEWWETASTLIDMGTYAVQTFRRNVLAMELCRIKDCFVDKSVGILVNSTGEQLEHPACFERRRAADDPTNYLVKIDVQTFMKNLPNYLQSHEEQRQRMYLSGFRDFPMLSYEDLTDFEFDPTRLGDAVAGWSEFLRGWGVTANLDKIMSILQPMVGSRPTPSLQKDIYNWDELNKALLESDARWLVSSI